MVLRSIFAGGWNGESELRSKSASVCERGGSVALRGWDTAEGPVLASERQRRIFHYSHGGRGSNILQTRSIAGYFSSARVGAGWLARFTSSRTLGAQGRPCTLLWLVAVAMILRFGESPGLLAIILAESGEAELISAHTKGLKLRA